MRTANVRSLFKNGNNLELLHSMRGMKSQQKNLEIYSLHDLVMASKKAEHEERETHKKENPLKRINEEDLSLVHHD